VPDARGNFKGMSVPADAWERIFGPGGLEEQQRRYEPESETGAFRAALEEEMRGAEQWVAAERERERQWLDRHMRCACRACQD